MCYLFGHINLLLWRCELFTCKASVVHLPWMCFENHCRDYSFIGVECSIHFPFLGVNNCKLGKKIFSGVVTCWIALSLISLCYVLMVLPTSMKFLYADGFVRPYYMQLMNLLAEEFRRLKQMTVSVLVMVNPVPGHSNYIKIYSIFNGCFP